MSKKTFILAHSEARRRAMAAVADAPDGFVVTVKAPTRNLDQNALLWVLLEKFATQLKWPVNGSMVSLSAEDWKHILSAAYSRESQRVAMGLDGGMVMLGMRTSKMGRREFSEFIDFIHATAAIRGVHFEETTV